jgi:Tfp pilus assembly protein PilF
MQKGEPGKAIPALTKALKWDPEFIQAQTTLASAYLMQGDAERSTALSEKAIAMEPSFAPAHNNLALALLEMGEKERAKKYALLALEYGFEMDQAAREELGV